MKKIYLSILILLIGGVRLQAQSLNGQNGVFYLQGDGNAILEGTVDIYNIGSSAVTVKVLRTDNNLAPNHQSYFCWGVNCFSPSVSLSPDSVYLPVGGFTSTFKGDLNPYLSFGVSRVTYCFFDMYNPGDSICMEFYYDVTTGINEIQANQNSLSIPYPNPADAMTSISYNLANNASDVKLLIRNILGAKVHEIKLASPKKVMVLNTSAFQQGVYFYSLIADGKVIGTNRLVVSHKN
ncbi:MAG: T9SS type A sorting domain-containing protein [Bacteroidia bacterium]